MKNKNIVIVSLAAVLAAAVLVIFAFPAPETQQAGQALEEKTGSGNGLDVSVTPVDFYPGRPVKFSIAFSTHQGSLDFDVTKVSVLEDSSGKVYSPVSWDGSGAGGHHREGTLAFPALSGNPAGMKLTISGVYGIPERVFSWELR